MKWQAAVLLCSVMFCVMCSAVPVDERKKLVGRAFFVVADGTEAVTSPQRPTPVAAATDLQPAATGHHKSHHSEGHKGKKGGKKSYKAGYVKGHGHKGKKGYHQDDHHEKHSYGDYAEGHHSKKKGGGGKDYKGSEHKEKHKGQYEKGDKGAKGKKFGHQGKYHKGHHDKGFKHKEDHDAHGHKHDDKYKKVTGKYGSAYEEEEGYFKKGKGKHHKGGKFAGGKTWDYKGGDSFSISGKYHDDYSDVMGKYGYHGEELHKHKKGAKGGHKSGKSHKKGDALKRHDHKGYHSHYAPVHHSPPAHEGVGRRGVAADAPVSTQKGSHSSPSLSKNLPVKSKADARLGRPRQHQIVLSQGPLHSQSQTLHRNPRQRQPLHRHPRGQRQSKAQNLDHTPNRGQQLRNENHPDPQYSPRYPHRATPSRPASAERPLVIPYANPLLAPSAKTPAHFNPHFSRDPRVNSQNQIAPPKRQHKNSVRRPHPNLIRNNPLGGDKGKQNARVPQYVASSVYDNKPGHSSHAVRPNASQGPRDSPVRSHSQSVSHPQNSRPPPPPPTNRGPYSQPEIAAPQHSRPDSAELPAHSYALPSRGPERGYVRGRPKKYKKPPVQEKEAINDAPAETYPENDPSHSEDQHRDGSESSRDNEYGYYDRELPTHAAQEDRPRENRIREDNRYHKNYKQPKPHTHEDNRSTHDGPYDVPVERQRGQDDRFAAPEHEPQRSTKQRYDERRYPADAHQRGYYSTEKDDSEPPYEDRQEAIDEPKYAHTEENEDTDGTPRNHNYPQHKRGRPRPYRRRKPSNQGQEEAPHGSPAPDQSQHHGRPSDEREQKASVAPLGGGTRTRTQQRGFYFPSLSHPLGFTNFAVGASNAPSVAAQKKLEPAASVFSLGHSQFSFDTFGDFGKFMPLPHNIKRQ